MIPLDHPIWQRLSCHTITGKEFAGILARYYDGMIPEGEELFEDMLQCICGGEIYDSSYAAAPHLVELARRAGSPAQAMAMLGFAADAYAGRKVPGSPAVDPALEQALDDLPMAALPLAREVLRRLDANSVEYGWHEATVRAFEGNIDAYRELRKKMMDRDCPDQGSGPVQWSAGSKVTIKGPTNTGSQQIQ